MHYKNQKVLEWVRTLLFSQEQEPPLPKRLKCKRDEVLERTGCHRGPKGCRQPGRKLFTEWAASAAASFLLSLTLCWLHCFLLYSPGRGGGGGDRVTPELWIFLSYTQEIGLDSIVQFGSKRGNFGWLISRTPRTNQSEPGSKVI